MTMSFTAAPIAPSPAGIESLTPRETDVLALMAEGWSNSAIARGLVVSERTVETHVANILFKLATPGSADENRRVRAVLAYLRVAETGARVDDARSVLQRTASR